ncbi:MAG TPA: MlaD family protein [Longimicrobiales bacterium]|nr:MlaD family protein [Longimicrobiales bacterium]
MMEYQVRNLTALGLLVLIAAGVFVWGFFFLLGDPILVGGTETVVLMENGAGLNRGDRVQLNGVQVGTVRRVNLEPPRRVTVEIRVNGGIRLPADTRAVAQADVFGATTIELLPGSALVALESGDTIQGVTAQPLPALASELGGQARTLLTAADSLLSPQAVSDLKATAAILPDVARQLQGAFAQLALATASLRRTAEELERAGTGAATGAAVAEVQGTARAARAALETMEVSLGSFASVMAKIDGGEGTLGRLVNDTTLYGELEATLREVRQLTSDIRAEPSKYLTVKIF